MLYEAPLISVRCLNLGTGYLCVGLANLTTTMQLGWREVITANVPLTQPPSMFMFRRKTTRAPTFNTIEDCLFIGFPERVTVMVGVYGGFIAIHSFYTKVVYLFTFNPGATNDHSPV